MKLTIRWIIFVAFASCGMTVGTLLQSNIIAIVCGSIGAVFIIPEFNKFMDWLFKAN